MAENKSSSSKSLLIFVIVLFALIAALCINIYIYYPLKNYPLGTVQPTVEPTPVVNISDWKTYGNEEYGFEIKYSQNPEWVAEEAKIINPEAIKPIISLINFFPKNKVYLLEESRVDPIAIIVSSGSLEDYYKVYPKSKNTIEKKVLINDLSFIRQVDEKWGGTSFAVEYPKQNFSFIITSRINALALGVSEKKLLEDTFNQMLSTFKFIE
ncbi:MAG: hypothetical protein Q8N37_01450 [bacterium]|nr:hypothetical protein [bacterium]